MPIVRQAWFRVRMRRSEWQSSGDKASTTATAKTERYVMAPLGRKACRHYSNMGSTPVGRLQYVDGGLAIL